MTRAVSPLHINIRDVEPETFDKSTEGMVKVNLQVSVAYLMCSPLQVLMKSWTWEKSVSKSGMFGMENFTNLEQKIEDG